MVRIGRGGWLILSGIFFIGILVTDCKKEETQVTDEEAIEDIITNSPFFNVTEHYEGGPVSDSGDTQTMVATMDTILPFLWGREIHERPAPYVEISIVGDSAFVNYTGYVRGYFDILTFMPDTGWIVLKKPLSETFHIKAVFKRTGDITDPNRGWELTHVTGAYGYSDSVHTVKIDSIRIQCDSYPDTLLVNPMDMFFNVDSILTFRSQEEVTITLYTNDETARPFIHIFQSIWPYHMRIPFSNMGGGMYQNQRPWRVQVIPQLRLAVFDFLEWETLFDSDYPYDFDGWLFPYKVVAE